MPSQKTTSTAQKNHPVFINSLKVCRRLCWLMASRSDMGLESRMSAVCPRQPHGPYSLGPKKAHIMPLMAIGDSIPSHTTLATDGNMLLSSVRLHNRDGTLQMARPYGGMGHPCLTQLRPIWYIHSSHLHGNCN